MLKSGVMINLILSAFLFLNTGKVWAQPNETERKTNRLFRHRTELYFRFLLKKQADLPALTRIVSIDHRKGDTLFAFANKRGMQQFFELGYSKFRILESPAEEYRRVERSQKKVKKKLQFQSSQAFDAYLTYPAYEQAMLQFQNQHPSLCRLVNLGTLPSGRKILALKISDSVDANQQEPRFLYTSSMHGDETAGYPLMLKLADTLLRGYGTDTELTRLVNEMEIWINPLANPDGTYRGGNLSVSGATRFNANNIDLNRNYPDPQDGLHPDGEAWQPETKIFMKLADSLQFVMAANFHGGAEVWNFPWDTWQRRNADENWWTAEGVKFSDSARAGNAQLFNENYGYPNLPGVCQGFEWYEVNGGRQDFMNWFHQCREVTIELSDVKLIPNNQIPPHWRWLRRSLIDFMKAALRGVRGQITDACTGLPVRARIEVRNHDKDSTHIFSTPESGNFHRPIFPGAYSLLVSAPGYQLDSITGILVGEGDALVRNLSLQPLAPRADFEGQAPGLCSSAIQFRDHSGSAATWNWDFGDGQFSGLKNPQHEFSGSGEFQVRLIVSNCAGSDTIVKVFNIISPPAPSAIGDTNLCGAKPQQLRAFSDGQVFWYANTASNIVLDSGYTFTTPALDSSQIYFVRSNKPLQLPYAGPADNQFGGGSFFTGNTYHYLSFDALMPFRLKSVKVFANNSGNRTIQLRNAQGQPIRSKTVLIPPGESRVQLDFDVPAGEGLQLGLAGGASNNLFRNNSGSSYPYEIGGVLSITGNSAGNPAFYYYFYNWEISASCQSEAVPVLALVQAPRPEASITALSDSLCEGSEVQLQANISQATDPQVSWFDGNSLLGTGNNLQAILTGPGVHSITCRLLSADTCAVKNPATSLPKLITVLPRPSVPLITVNGNWLVSSSGPVNWFLLNQPIGNTATDSILISESGSYSAMITGTNGCANFSQPVDITPVAGIENQTLRIIRHEEHILVENTTGKIQSLEIFDAAGRCVRRLKADTGISRFGLTGIPSGLLLLRNPESGYVLKLLR